MCTTNIHYLKKKTSNEADILILEGKNSIKRPETYGDDICESSQPNQTLVAKYDHGENDQ